MTSLAKEADTQQKEFDHARMVAHELRIKKHDRDVKIRGRIDTFLAFKRLKVLKRHFSIWLTAVVVHRDTLDRMLALSEFRHLLQGWNIWRAHFRAVYFRKQADREKRDMIKEQRGSFIAHQFNTVRILTRTFIAWQVSLRD